MKRFLILALLLAPVIAERSKQAWSLSGKGTKPIECYFWTTKIQVSTVACAPLKRPTDEISIILPADATDLYHTHPKGFPALSEADKAAQRKSGVHIHVVHW